MQALPTVVSQVVEAAQGSAELGPSYELHLARAAPAPASATRFRDILLDGLAPDGGLYLPERLSACRSADELARWRDAVVCGSRVRDPVDFIDDIPADDLRALTRKTYTAEVYSNVRTTKRRADHAAEDARRRERRAAVAAGTVERPDARVQGHGDAVARQPVRVRAGAARRDAEHPRRDLRRHRQRGRIRDARQEGRARVHALAARPHERVPAGADVQPAGRRTSTTSRSKACSTTARTSSRRSPTTSRSRRAHKIGTVNSINWARLRGAGRLLLRRLFRRRRRRNDERVSASRCRRATSATSAPATSRA